MLAVLSMLFRADFRHRWRSWLYLALLVALVSGLVLAGMAAGRRTASAFPRYLAAYGSDVEAFSFKPIPTIASLPEVEESTSVLIPANGPPACSGCRLLANQNFGITGLAPRDLSRQVKLLSGRMPDQSNPAEVLASYTMQRDLGIHLGSHVRIRFASERQRNDVLNGANITPEGPLYDFKVVGIEASEDEFSATSSTNYGLYTTKAFTRSINDRTVFFHADYVRLRHGAADLPRFQAQARQIGPVGMTDLDTNAAAVNSSIRPQAVGWWILAALTALVGLIVLAQAQGRQASIEEDAYGTLRTLGVSRWQLFLAGMARTAAIGVVGVVGGLLLAYGLSSLAPVGEARLAEPTNGFSFDTWALLIGGLVLLAAFLVLGAWPALKVARAPRTGGRSRRQRPSRTVGLLADLGASPSKLIGVRRALQRGGDRSTVPVASALLGSILAVTALCATAVFGSSLTHLITTPALYGQRFDLDISVNSGGRLLKPSSWLTTSSGNGPSRGSPLASRATSGSTATPWPPWRDNRSEGRCSLRQSAGGSPTHPTRSRWGRRRYEKLGPTSAPSYGCQCPMLMVGRGLRHIGWSALHRSHPISEPADWAPAPSSTSPGSVPDVRPGPSPVGVRSTRPTAERA